MSSKRGSAGESRIPKPQRKPTRSFSSAGLAAPPSSPLPPHEAASTIAVFSEEEFPKPFSLSEEDCLIVFCCC